MGLEINNHNLKTGRDQELDIEIKDDKQAKKNKKKMEEVKAIIIHYTADGRANGAKAVNYLTSDVVMASAHIVIGRDGTIHQLVPFDTESWHAGVSSYRGMNSFNKFSIGIELDNAGRLQREGSTFVTWFGDEIPKDEVEMAIHQNRSQASYWHKYTDKQLDVCEALCRALLQDYDNIDYILGHDEIAPTRKVDPGPLFPMDKFRKNVLEETTPDSGKVSASRLNIRSGPGASFNTVAVPLRMGKEVKVLKEEKGWYYVETKIKGWVSKGYVETDK